MPEQVVHAYLRDDATIVLLSRDGDGRRVVRHVPAEWVAYFRQSDLDDALVRNLRTSVHVKSVRTEGSWLRVGFIAKAAREDFCGERRSFVAQLGIPVYEADVHPIVRYMVDTGAVVQKPRRVYLDIETDSRCTPLQAKNGEARIISWALVDEDERVQVGVLTEDTDRDERRLLDALWQALKPYDQVAAWSGDDFDFPVIFARSAARGCIANANDYLWLDHLELFRRMNLNASESGEEKQSMKLNDIAQAICGEGKEEIPPDVAAKFGPKFKSLGGLTYQLWAEGGDWRALMVRYMLKDADLLRKIEKETGYAALFQTLCEVCHIFGDSKSINPTHQMDGFMLRLGLERDYHFPTKRYREGMEKFAGAFVMEPETHGIEHDVHVCDFASLYPSIILTWNMSPDTKVSLMGDNVCVSPLTGIHFRTDKTGILPVALAELIRLRKHWNDLKSSLPPGTPEWHDANRKSMAYKVAANSFYGVVGSPFSRFFDRTIAESVTQCGVWLIRKTIEAAKERGWKAIYGDTDSVFVKGCTKEQFDAFTEWCNTELYPRILKEVGCRENKIKLAYEKAFAILVMTTAKRYAGRYAHYKGKAATADSKPEIKGLEYKRGDASLLTRRLQAQMIDLLCGGLKLNPGIEAPTSTIVHFHDALVRMRKHVLEEPLPIEEIRISKSLSKPLNEYVRGIKNDGSKREDLAHVGVAKILRDRGQTIVEGSRVEYIVVDGASSPQKVIPADDYTGGEVDRFYVWERVVFPPTQRLLEAAFPEEDWKGWLKVRPAKPRASRKKQQAA